MRALTRTKPRLKTKPRKAAPARSQPPREIKGPSAWYGRDMMKTDEWLFRLSKADIAEIDRAVKASRHLPIHEITRKQFPLPNLGKRLKALLKELLDGRGIDYPHVTGSNVTHRRAARAGQATPEPMELFAAESPTPYGSEAGEPDPS